MAAPTATVGELIESLNQLDHSAHVSILLDEEDGERIAKSGGHGIFTVFLMPDDSDGEVFLNLGRMVTSLELVERVKV